MHIELRTAPGCPNADAAKIVLAECLNALGVDVPIVECVGAYPSPTLVIDGVDVMRPVAGPPEGQACRLDVPTPERVLDAIVAAGAGPTQHGSVTQTPSS